MSDVTMLDVSRTASSSKVLSDLSVIHDELMMVYYGNILPSVLDHALCTLDRLFPVEELVKWLSYGNGMHVFVIIIIDV